MPVLKIRGLTKRYGKLTALDNLDMDIEAGNVYGILGPNGSGKTTTLGIILGILNPNSGTYTWFDDKYGDKFRLKIGSILETPNFYPYLNAQKNLEIVSLIKKDDNRDYTELLKLVDLYDRKHSKFRTYSLGMKQRLAIAATLIGSPEVLIFDEPTNGLDPQGIAEVRRILKRIADSGKTVIMASHLLDEVEKICSHVAIVKKGKLMAIGPVGSILSDDIIIEIGAEDKAQLLTLLRSLTFINSIKDQGNFYECTMDKTHTAAEINKLAYNHGLIITHLVGKHRSLEEEFLTITGSK